MLELGQNKLYRPSFPSSPTYSSPPHIDFIKQNFDDASNGNLGLTSYGYFLNNAHIQITHIYVGEIVHTTNIVSKI